MLKAIRTLTPFFKPYRGRLLLVMLSVLVVTGVGLLAPWLIRLLVQIVRLTEGDLAAATQSLITITLGLLVVYLLRSAGQFINLHVSHVVAFGLVHDLQVAVYQHLQRFSPAYFSERQSGEIVSRVVKDTVEVEPVVADAVYDFVVSFLLAVGIVVILLTLDVRLTLLTLVPVPFALASVLELVAQLNRERGMTIVLVLHDLNQAARYADRMIVLNNGAIAADGSPSAVLTPCLTGGHLRRARQHRDRSSDRDTRLPAVCGGGAGAAHTPRNDC